MVHTPDDIFTISSSTALGMAENLVLLLNSLVKNLPERELRKVRNALERTVHVADDLLLNITISSGFNMLTLSDVSTTLGKGTTTASPMHSRTLVQENTKTNSKIFVPPPSPASVTIDDIAVFGSPVLNGGGSAIWRRPTHARNEPAPAPIQTPATHAGPRCPLIISSRSHVGHPDYEFHPEFVRAGIPGPYLQPPVDSSKPDPTMYYVVTKGLYVGIFTSWNECSPWVIKVPGSVFSKVRQWAEARNLYNGRLAAGSCEVLS